MELIEKHETGQTSNPAHMTGLLQLRSARVFWGWECGRGGGGGHISWLTVWVCGVRVSYSSILRASTTVDCWAALASNSLSYETPSKRPDQNPSTYQVLRSGISAWVCGGSCPTWAELHKPADDWLIHCHKRIQTVILLKKNSQKDSSAEIHANVFLFSEPQN